jgi:hypothetical protein
LTSTGVGGSYFEKQGLWSSLSEEFIVILENSIQVSERLTRKSLVMEKGKA